MKCWRCSSRNALLLDVFCLPCREWVDARQRAQREHIQQRTQAYQDALEKLQRVLGT